MTLTKRFFIALSSLALGASVTACGSGNQSSGCADCDAEVTVGILHSLSGTMAISESTLVDTEKMAIEEINAAGGIEVGGKKYEIKYIVEDGASDWPTFAEKSKKLITQDKVPVVFGGWTSASRKAMLPVYESKDAFLYYPIQYEGQECSNNIFYTGATPNQQSEPATEFMFKRSPAAGKPFFLVGSDYVFPRTSNTITKEQVKSLGGKVVGEDYLPLGNTEVAPIIAKIKKALPNGGVIINTLNGDQNVAFFKQIQDVGITPKNGYYVMSYSIAEEEISTIGPEFLEGHYGAWNYMMSINSSASKKFAKNFQKRWGADRVVADPQESAYNMVYLWKAAVEKAGTFDDNAVRKALVGIKFDAPQGPVEVMPNHHISQTVRIGKITSRGQFKILESTNGPIAPQAWNQFEPSSKGYACDWTNARKGERYRF
ncbi:urea ABC transporter substrate-binding protein [Prochlorococcus sp. MIT 1341]|uniref:urea ABC transporter substrate-binding protein n=1 Tax=Prochlorococcus sp. MIT 1341 TaxID=3096221 RepID=UPI002A762377|nr:urea ABC transporter substrate-binding protein [Prochlorococcus sp. MIT 1341]